MAVKTVQPQKDHQPTRITVDQYEHMVQAGVFAEDERIELIEGQILNMSPIGSAHSGQVKRLNRILAKQVADLALISIQDPIRLPQSEPQPDLALLKPRDDFYASAHPTARDVLLVVEVADTSADYDRNEKIPLYGRSGIAEAWLIDLANRSIEVYRGPGRAGFAEKKTYAHGDELAPVALPEIHLAVAEILGASA